MRKLNSKEDFKNAGIKKGDLIKDAYCNTYSFVEYRDVQFIGLCLGANLEVVLCYDKEWVLIGTFIPITQNDVCPLCGSDPEEKPKDEVRKHRHLTLYDALTYLNGIKGFIRRVAWSNFSAKISNDGENFVMKTDCVDDYAFELDEDDINANDWEVWTNE